MDASYCVRAKTDKGAAPSQEERFTLQNVPCVECNGPGRVSEFLSRKSSGGARSEIHQPSIRSTDLRNQQQSWAPGFPLPEGHDPCPGFEALGNGISRRSISALL